MQLMERVKGILLKPRETWAAIDGEPADTARLFTGYLMILAAIPAVCGFIGMSLIGMGGFGFSMRVPLLAGLANMAVFYVLSLVGVYVLALVINALAPTFGGTQNQGQALKVAVYASTAAMLGGVFSLLPALAILGLVAALYSLYLLYLGLPLLMRSPAARAVPYTAVVVVVAIVLGIVIAAIGSLFMPHGPAMWGSAGGPAVVIDTPRGQVTLDTAKLEEAGKKMEEAARRMEQAHKSGDTQQMTEAAGQAMAAAMGGAKHQTVGVDALKAALPAKLGSLERTSYEVHDGAATGLPTSQAEAEYGNGDKVVRISVVDAGAFGQLAQLAGMVQGERESDGIVEKTWQENGRTLHHSYAKDGSQAELRAVLKNGVVVTVEAENLPLKDVQGFMGQIDLAALENLPRKDKS